MALHYIDSGRYVRTNHIINPDFEIDASSWKPLNSYSTIEVVTGHQFHGGKALKVTGNGANPANSYGATYDGPLIAVADVQAPNTFGAISLVAYVSSDTAGALAALGGFQTGAAGLAGAFTSGTGPDYGTSTTPTRRAVNLDQLMTVSNADYVIPSIVFRTTGPGVYYIDAVMLTVDHSPSFGFPNFIVGSRTDGQDGLAYDWTGTPHASTSTGTALRLADIPTVGNIGASFTITGSGFVPSESLQVNVYPEVESNSYFATAADSSGGLNYTFTMPANAAGTTTVRVVAGASYGEQDVAVSAAAAGLSAQVFVGGTARAVSEARVSEGGTLINVTNLGT